MKTTQFKISGAKRKEKKKELSLLKSFLNRFWQFEDCNRVGGAGMNDADCEKLISEKKLEISKMERDLAEMI